MGEEPSRLATKLELRMGTRWETFAFILAYTKRDISYYTDVHFYDIAYIDYTSDQNSLKVALKWSHIPYIWYTRKICSEQINGTAYLWWQNMFEHDDISTDIFCVYIIDMEMIE